MGLVSVNINPIIRITPIMTSAKEVEWVRAFFRRCQGLVGLAHFVKALRAFLLAEAVTVSAAFVWVKFQRRLVVCLLHLPLAGVTWHAEHMVWRGTRAGSGLDRHSEGNEEHESGRREREADSTTVATKTADEASSRSSRHPARLGGCPTG